MMQFKMWLKQYQTILNFSVQIFLLSLIITNIFCLNFSIFSIFYHFFIVFLIAFLSFAILFQEQKVWFNFFWLKKDFLTLIYVVLITSYLFFSFKTVFNLATLILCQNYLLLLFFWIEKISILSLEKLWEKKYLQTFSTTVQRVVGTEIQTIDKKNLQIGEIFYVKKDQIVPLDGVIIQGSALVEEPYQSEVEDSEKYIQDGIIAGTKIKEGSLYILYNKTYSNQSFQKIITFFSAQVKQIYTLQKSDFFVIFGLSIYFLFLFFLHLFTTIYWFEILEKFSFFSFWILLFPFQAFSRILYLKKIKEIFNIGVLTSMDLLSKNKNIRNFIFMEKDFYKPIWRLEEIKTFNISVDEVYVLLKKLTPFDSFLQKIHWVIDINISKYRFNFVQTKQEKGLWAKEKNGDIYRFTAQLPKLSIPKNMEKKQEISDSMPESAEKEFQDFLEEVWQDEHQEQDFYLLKNEQIIAQFIIRPELKKNVIKSLEALHQKRKKIIFFGKKKFDFTTQLEPFFDLQESIEKSEKMITFLQQKGKLKNRKTLILQDLQAKNLISAEFMTIDKISESNTEKLLLINEDFFALNSYLQYLKSLYQKDFWVFFVLCGIFCIFTIGLFLFKFSLAIQIGMIVILITVYLFFCSKINAI